VLRVQGYTFVGRESRGYFFQRLLKNCWKLVDKSNKFAYIWNNYIIMLKIFDVHRTAWRGVVPALSVFDDNDDNFVLAARLTIAGTLLRLEVWK
jgi:hypothetical protein